MKYEIKDDFIIQDDIVCIPRDINNRQYQRFLDWEKEGNVAPLWLPTLPEAKLDKQNEIQATIDKQEVKAQRPSQDIMAFGTDYPEYENDLSALKNIRTAISRNRELKKQVETMTDVTEIMAISPITATF